MLAYDPERQTYAPGPAAGASGPCGMGAIDAGASRAPASDALSEAVGETVHLAQLDHAQVLYIDKRNAGEPVQMYSQAGKVGPAYCTGVGKAMLAFLDEATVEAVIAQQSFHVFTATHA